jgi:ABC-type amino acid transport substrate-binding protein
VLYGSIGCSSGAGEAATLDHLRQDNVIRIAYRPDAPPFSYQDSAGKPTGFIVELCQAVAKTALPAESA